jgi:hypothetical protein
MDNNTVGKIEELTVFKTTDGKYHETMDAACDHQEDLDFKRWCDANICAGGEWTSGMVSKEILKHWRVTPRGS